MAVVLNAAPVGNPLIAPAQAAIRGYNVSMVPVVLHQREAFDAQTQAVLPRRAGPYPTAISEIEHCATNPTLKTVHAIALALDVELMVLLNRRLFKSKTIDKQIAAVED